ncbi:hypothetical protein L9F63_018632, partial [Diploptera punctata]
TQWLNYGKHTLYLHVRSAQFLHLHPVYILQYILICTNVYTMEIFSTFFSPA